ncbi:DUF4173 domain-containing protein [Arcicella sp. DC2W]|uniref:DUF4173 domain-containing protein n=1 Tax=Arcicella gelida TaxID=2984195 RepID=A0ABU5S5J3_9BACT|nr:DUF4173 domain-containing protein [Arcicella sp. DC2W]MEA5403765.1 DUF4173 domain-containing protein [Arcicella sp. DC2W]
MNNKKILLAFTSIAFSYLFYQQSAGINFLIFTIIVIVGMLITQPDLIKNKAWQIVAFGSVLSSGMIVFHHSNLSIIAFFCSLILLIGVSNHQDSSIYVGLLKGFVSIAFSSFKILFENFDEYILSQKKLEKKGFSIQKTTAFYIIPLLITFVFYLLYASANPEFGSYFQLPKDIISLQFCLFFLVGTMMSVGLYYQFFGQQLTEWDISLPNTLIRNKQKEKKIFQLTILKIENTKGIIVFSMLNLLLLFFNFVDFSVIFSDQKLPKGIHYSSYVHQGVNTLIFSAILAISIILYYFRANQNFYSRNKWLKRLAYVWIFQNTLLLIGVIFKNQLYISEFGLTYKRIGVYVFLILTTAGLISTFWKVLHQKTIWFLLRNNSWFAYFLLIVSSFTNWDSLIASYNINKANQLDVTYLLNLSDNTLPALKTLLVHPKANLDTKVFDYIYLKEDEYYKSAPIITQRVFILKQIDAFEKQYKAKQWQSWNYADEQIFKQLNKQ